ncbi:MAG: GNAT family N-acetyltransferase [Oscillospiraceae bacterium]|nr:GNAT family N-acetyltransferase [Oscillospiraceae bacterium]
MVTLRPVERDEREILANLLEKYNYEFSQYDGTQVNRLGLFGCRHLDLYWLEGNRWAYFIEADDKLAGFVMINDIPEASDRETDFSVAEFFVMYPHRRKGVGKQAFYMAADLHKGRWQLKRHPKNIPSVYFWDNIINQYTNGHFELVKSYPGADYPDGSLGDIFFFDNS